jgi:hypothetical protein
MDAMIFSVAVAFVAAIFLLLALGADDFVTGAPSTFKDIDILGGRWNWTGKLASLALSGFVSLLSGSRYAVGSPSRICPGS